MAFTPVKGVAACNLYELLAGEAEETTNQPVPKAVGLPSEKVPPCRLNPPLKPLLLPERTTVPWPLALSLMFTPPVAWPEILPLRVNVPAGPAVSMLDRKSVV